MIREDAIIKEALKQAGISMLARAKTAPKAKGVDDLEYILLEKEDFPKLIEEMRSQAIDHDIPFFIRDANNLESSDMLLLIGCIDEPRNVPNCGFCGYVDCSENRRNKGRCVYPSIDLGIALGSALSLGQSLGIDSRVMMSLGKAAMNLDIFEKDVVTVIALPLSISKKSIYFDRATS